MPYNKDLQEKNIYDAFMQSPVAIGILRGEDYVIEFANEFYLNILAKDKTIIGKPLFTSFPELIPQGIKEFMDNVVENKVAKHIAEHEFSILKKGIKEQCFFNCDYQPLREIDEKITGLIVIFTEVTQQVLLKRNNLINQNELITALKNANNELTKQSNEKGKRAAELIIANVELEYQNTEKRNRANELIIANEELEYQNAEKKNRADELIIANVELDYQNTEKKNRADELIIANVELDYQNTEKKNRADELIIANVELDYQNTEKKNRADELIIANVELEYQNTEKKNRADELIIANVELDYQNTEKNNRAAELVIANVELDYQNTEKKNRADELIIANKELLFQINEKGKRAAELVIANYARSLIEASLDPLITINTEGKITDMNVAMIDAVDISREKLLDSNFTNYFTDKNEAKKLYENVFTNGKIINFPLTLKDGKLIDVLYNGSIFKDGNGCVLGAVLVGRDITEQKRVEQELVEARIFAEFATTIAEEAKEKAEIATAFAEEAVKAKQQFLSNMSHEIRTPMNAIIGFTKVALRTELTPKQKEYISAIKMSGDSLIVLINDILDIAKVDAGKMTFEKAPFKLALSIDAMLHLFETKISEKNLTLVKEYDEKIPTVIIGDAIRLHQIILNLVGNAVKFTEYGSITMAVKLVGEDDKKVTIEFSIIDTGIGIKAEKIQAIFDNFTQATNTTSRLYGGSGLGLAIVKQLVDLQGGNVAVKSTINEGSTFSFILNFDKSDSDEILEAEIMELDETVKDIKILVVEDMPLNQLLMKTLLDDFGFESDISANGKLALEKLATKTYDIILMDLQMPEMNGFEATEYIRNTLKSSIPIIALTADVTTVDVAKCKAVGMNDYVSKPVDERLLYSKIVGLIKKPEVIVSKELLIEAIAEEKIIKCIDLQYLNTRTKSNPALMMQMMSIYLEQTPPLISLMKKSFADKDWNNLDAAVHKMIPSFAIMGMHNDYEAIAKKIQRYAAAKKEEVGINDLVTQLENILGQSCRELEIEFNNLKNNNK